MDFVRELDAVRAFLAQRNFRGAVIGEPDSAELFDLERDVATTAEDGALLRRLRRDVPSWFSLTPVELEALVPPGALDRRPVTSHHARPFTLP